MDLNKIVCPCVNVTAGMISEAVSSGARTLEEVMAKTNAGSICGACTDEVKNCMDYFIAESKA